MKIAVATTDGVQLSQHFGRSAGFIIYEVYEKTFQKAELRSNHHTPHAQGLCDGAHGHDHGHSSHNHSSIVQLLGDCQAVLCGGMGAGAANALVDSGIQPHVVPEPCSAEEALLKFLSGEVNSKDTVLCKCQHSEK